VEVSTPFSQPFQLSRLRSQYNIRAKRRTGKISTHMLIDAIIHLIGILFFFLKDKKVENKIFSPPELPSLVPSSSNGLEELESGSPLI